MSFKLFELSNLRICTDCNKMREKREFIDPKTGVCKDCDKENCEGKVDADTTKKGQIQCRVGFRGKTVVERG